MAKKKTTNPANTEFITEPSGKVIGPGTNPDQVKFEGTTDGPFYVHCKNGQPIEAVHDHANPENGWFVRYGGTEAECHTFAGR